MILQIVHEQDINQLLGSMFYILQHNLQNSHFTFNKQHNLHFISCIYGLEESRMFV